MGIPFVIDISNGETYVSIDIGLSFPGPAVPSNSQDPLWLASSSSSPQSFIDDEWPTGLAASVNRRLESGKSKGRVLYVLAGPSHSREPLAALCWHFHDGNWPLTILDMGYANDVDDGVGRRLINEILLPAFASLNDNPKVSTKKVVRPSDHLAWMVTNETGAGTKGNHCRAIATRAQGEWGFASVKGKNKPPFAQSKNGKGGFYGIRKR